MIDKYNNHVVALAQELGCRIDLRPGTPGMMYVELGYVEGPEINNQIDYIVNLHELGHFAWGHTQGRPPHQDKRFYFDNGVLKSEAQAWEWALDRCVDELAEATRRFAWDYCLGSYYSHAIQNQGVMSRLWNGNRHHVEFLYDLPDEYFTSVVKRIQGDIKNYKINYYG